MARADRIDVVDAEGRRHTVTERAFDVIYRLRGWRKVEEAKASKAKASSAEAEAE